MLFIATVTLSHYLFIIPLILISVFLILLILVQRGRGGGLTGALGGMGGQSAFGTKAGDLFTRITIVVATIWILICMLSVKQLRTSENMLSGLPENQPASSSGAQPGPGTGTGATGSESGATGENVPASDKPAEEGGT